MVVKVAGALLDDAAAMESLARQVAQLAHQGHEILMVHGGGKIFTATLKRMGIDSRFVNGLRVTDRETRARVRLADAPAESLRSAVYNVGGFSPSAGELAETVRTAFPGEQVTFAPAPHRQAIVDSWPEDVDDAGARRDWGFRPSYDLDRAFDEYLVPNVRDRYIAR